MHVRQVVCAVDFDDSSLNTVAYGLSIAEEADAYLTLVNVIDLPPGFVQSTVETERLRRLRLLIPEAARTYCSVEPVVTTGPADRQILEVAAAWNADLIVMGVYGRAH